MTKSWNAEAGAFVNISDADLSSGRYHTLKVVDYYNRESVTILFKNTNIPEETTTTKTTETTKQTETTKEDQPTEPVTTGENETTTREETEGSIKIEGVQINTKIGGTRVVAKVTDNIKDKKVASFGLIYGLLKYNGKETKITSDQMKLGMENQFVKAYNTTTKGILEKLGNETTYVRTMTYGKNSKDAYTAEYKVRAYAVLEDGENNIQ